MNNDKINQNKISISRLILTLFMLLIVVVGGTFAWLTYSSKEAALVLTIGDINNTQIELSPYQVSGTIAPSTTYTAGVESQVVVSKGSNNSTSFALYYRINDLDMELVKAGLSYTVVDAGSGSQVASGKFSDLINTSSTSMPSQVLIFDANALGYEDASTTYKVYLWLDGTTSNQVDVSGSSLDVELNASIASVTITGTNRYGETLSTTIDDAIVDNTNYTYSYQWYSNTSKSTKGGTKITGATNSTYTIQRGLTGKYIYVEVTSTNGQSKGKTLSDVTDAVMSAIATNVTAGTSTRVYNCSALTNSNCTADNLLNSNHKVTCVMTSNSKITNVGSQTNEISTVTITDENGNDVTNDYAITKVSSTLTVTKATVTMSVSPTTGTVEAMQSKTFVATAKSQNCSPSGAGTITATSGNTTAIVMSGTSPASLKPTTSGTNSTITYKGTNVEGTSKIVVTYEHANTTDSNNFKVVSATYTATNDDSIAPALGNGSYSGIETTNNLKSTTQIATLRCTDAAGVRYYYFGTKSSPAASDYTTITLTTAMEVSKTISTAGTYSLYCKDAAGNVSDGESVTYYKYVVNNMLLNITGTENAYTSTNYTAASSGTYIALSGTTLTIDKIYTKPTGADVSTYKGISTGAASSTAATLGNDAPKLSANTTYSVWFNRLTYTITVTSTVGGKNVITNERNLSATASEASTSTLSIRYNEKVTANATTSTGYAFTGFGGLLSGTTTPQTTKSQTADGTITASFEKVIYTVTYDYATNGGTSATKTTEDIPYDTAVDLTPTATKSGWVFVGWNTDKNATTKLTSLTIGASDITLYAIFSKTTTATFYYYEDSIKTAKSTCTRYNTAARCNYTAPSFIGSSTIGPYSTKYVGVSTSLSSMTTTTTYTSDNSNYYSVYRTDVTEYHATTSTSSTASSRTIYRNSFFTSISVMKTVLNTSNTATSDFTPEVGRYSTTFAGYATSFGTMSASYSSVGSAASNTSTKLYTIYRTQVALFRPSTTAACSTGSWYRNVYLTSNTSSTVVFSDTTTGTTDVTPTVPSGYTFAGFATALNTTSVTNYETVAKAASSTVTKLYVVGKKTVTATFYYYNSGIKTETSSEIQYVVCTSATAAKKSDQEMDVPVNYEDLTCQYGGVGIGWATSGSTMSTSSVTTGYTSYYLVCRQNVTEYYTSTSTTAASRTLYRNAFFTSTNSMTTVLSTSSTSTSNYTQNVGRYNTTWVGYATTSGTMTAVYGSVASAASSTSTALYSLYRTNVTLRFSNSVTVCSSITWYRNVYLTATNASTAVIAYNKTDTVNATMSPLSGYSIAGLATSSNTTSVTYKTLEAAASSTNTTLYVVDYTSVTATFYYYNSGIKTGTGSATQYVICKSNTASTISNSTITAPTAASSATSQYGGTFVGWATAVNTMSTSNVNTGNTTYYGVYRKNVTEYYTTTSTTATSRTIYRNAFFSSTSAMTTVLSTSTTATSNHTPAKGCYGTSWFSYETAVNKMTGTYSSVASAASTTYTTLYSTYSVNVTEFYTSTSTTAASRTLYRSVFFNSTTATTAVLNTSGTNATTNVGAASTIGRYGASWVGYSSTTNDMTTSYASIGAAASSTSTKIYSLYRKSVTNYYTSTSTNAATQTLYRNVFFTSDTASKVVLSSASTGNSTAISDFTPVAGRYNTSWVGFNTSTGTMVATYSTVASAASSTSTILYSIYRTNVIVYYQTSATVATTATRYRNVYLTATNASTAVFAGSNTGTVHFSTVPQVSGYTFYGFATAVNSRTRTYETIESVATVTNTAVYSIGTQSITSKFYYYSSGIKSATAGETRYIYSKSATASTVYNSEISEPVDVTKLTSQYGATGIGWANAVSKMSTTSVTTANANYYAVYRINVTVIRPSSTSACSSATWYRNAFFTATNSMNTVLSSSTTGTSNSTPTQPTGYGFEGFVTSANSISSILLDTMVAENTTTKFYSVSTMTDSSKFYYVNGSATIKSSTVSATRYLYCSSDTAATVPHVSLTEPVTVTSILGPYSQAGIGWATSVNSMSLASSITTANENYYAVYRGGATLYYPSSTSACTNSTLYRNTVFTSASAIKTVLSTSDTGTDNIAPTQVTGYSLYGITSTVNSFTRGYSSVGASASSTNSPLYAISYVTKDATFYHYNSGIKSETNTFYKYLYCKSNTAAAIEYEDAGVTTSTSQYGSAFVGWATTTSSMSTVASINYDNVGSTYYGVYRSSVNVYYPSSTSTCSGVTWNRKAYFTATNSMTTVLSGSTAGTSNNAIPTQVSGWSFASFTTATGSTANTYSSVSAAASSTSSKIYSVSRQTATGTFYYYSSGIKSANGTGYRYLVCSSTTAAKTVQGTYTAPVTITSLSSQYGSTGVGWANKTLTMSTASLSTGSSVYYAVYRKNVKIYKPTGTVSTNIATDTYYRNAFFSSTSSMITALDGSSTGTGNLYPSVNGWTFHGVTSTVNTYTAQYTSMPQVASTTLTTLYGIFKNSSTLTYDKNGGSGSIASSTGTVYIYCKSTTSATYSKASFTVKSNSFTAPTGFKFSYWTLNSKTTSATTYQPNATLGVLNTSNTLYARWNQTVMFVTNGCIKTGSTQTKYYGISLTAHTGTSTKTGYDFLGWSTSSSSTSATYAPGGTISTNFTSGTTVLYAVCADITAPSIEDVTTFGGIGAGTWTNSIVNVQIDYSDSGSGINTKSCTYNDGTVTKSATGSSTSCSVTFSNEQNKAAYMSICDNAGNCSNTYSEGLHATGRYVTVMIDKTKPTCGTWTLAYTGVYSANLSFSPTDALSGVAAKGIGSSTTTDYNNLTSKVVGTTIETVYCYVKDNAGNETVGYYYYDGDPTGGS